MNRNEAEIWIFPTAHIDYLGVYRENSHLLCPEEKDKLSGLSLEKVKRQYLFSRVMVRKILSKYAPVRPEHWQFKANAYGRPEISKPPLSPRLWFNLSHCEGLIVCAVAWDHEIGVDVENRISRDSSRFLDIAQRYFSRDESKELQSLPSERQLQRFFEYWTLKEAYIKAKGLGLSLPLDRFTFEIQPSGQISISFDTQEDDSSHWQFQFLPLSDEHVGAIAINKGISSELSIVTHPYSLD